MTLLYFLSYENWVRNVPEGTAGTSTAATATVATVPPVPVAAKAQVKLPTEWKKTTTTLFWVGEGAGADNDFITNAESYWDEHWEESFGGVDTPQCRRGYHPCGFTPKENPFYFALPYAEYDEHGEMKASSQRIPWYDKDPRPLLKNRWIAVRHAGNTCYAQWEDVGPNGEDDFAYVFGEGSPVNTFGEKAGLDVSPALWKCLQMLDNGETDWAFVDESNVPEGPWKDIVTSSGISWGT